MVSVAVRLSPIVGSMASVDALVREVVAMGGSVSSQGLPLLYKEDGNGKYSSLMRVGLCDLNEILNLVSMAWRHAWCEYQESPNRRRGRPTARIAYHFLISLRNCNMADEEIHRLCSVFFVRLDEIRNARLFVFVTRPRSEIHIHVLVHPVDLHGFILRFEDQFPQKFQEILETVFLSDIRKVTKIWLSS